MAGQMKGQTIQNPALFHIFTKKNVDQDHKEILIFKSDVGLL
jgi:hypothetical protein